MTDFHQFQLIILIANLTMTMTIAISLMTVKYQQIKLTKLKLIMPMLGSYLLLCVGRLFEISNDPTIKNILVCAGHVSFSALLSYMVIKLNRWSADFYRDQSSIIDKPPAGKYPKVNLVK